MIPDAVGLAILVPPALVVTILGLIALAAIRR